MYLRLCFNCQSLIPRIAAKLDEAPISDITGINGEKEYVRTIYAGNAVQTIQSSNKVDLITVRGTAFPPSPTTGGSCTPENSQLTYTK